jgi:hypothetical protein
MGQPCTVCTSPHGRDVVDLAIVAGNSYSAIAARFGLNAQAVRRHAREHLPPQMRAAILTATAADDTDMGYDRLADVEKEGVLAAVIKQRARLFALADMCSQTGDVGGAIAAEAAIGRNIQLSSRIVGRFAAVQVNHAHQHVLLSADYLAFRKRLLAALATIPAEHARTIAAALHEGETEAAAQIAPPTAHPAPMATPEPPAGIVDAEFEEVPADIPPCPVGPRP